MSNQRRPLVLFPNGALARCEEVPLEGILVIEPEPKPEVDFPAVIDQTQAVKEAQGGNNA